jgi:hypothetical protein
MFHNFFEKTFFDSGVILAIFFFKKIFFYIEVLKLFLLIQNIMLTVFLDRKIIKIFHF